MPKSPSYRDLFRSRSFSALWTGQVISQSGDGIFDVVLLWVVWKLTGSVFLVGLTQGAVLAPSIFVGPFAGVYADRWNRRNMMIASSLFEGAVTAGITALYFLGLVTFAPLFVLVLLLFSGAEFYRAANSAMLPSIVPRENLGAANGLFSLSTQTNQLVSYAVGGVVLALVGATAAISYDSLTFFVASGLLTMVVRTYGDPRGSALSAQQAPRASFWRDFREGLGYVRKNRLFVELSTFGLMANFFGAGFGAIIAPLVGRQLGGDEVSFGLVLASLSLGGIMGAIGVGKMNFRSYVGKLLFGGVFLFAPLSVLAGLATTVPEGIGVFFGIGILAGAINLPIQALVQTQVPREILGRAVTVLRALLGMAAPTAAVVFGLIAGVTSVADVMIASGIGLALITVGLYIPFKELRRASY